MTIRPSIVLPLILLFCAAHAETTEDAEITDEPHHGEEEGELPEPPYAVLFPSFTVTLGVFVFYILSRYAKALPYTAVMFLLGTIMGIVVEIGDFKDHIDQGIRLWIGINGEVLLLVFLPGLLFKDAMSQNVHHFFRSISQLLIFAFPLVLAGTVLTALVAYYIFPYGWPFNLAMTFGAILAATDPVAVAALLEEVGAPPRLQIHIAGESLLNDGAAIVFYSIFVQKYFFEDLQYIGGDEHAENIDLAKGVAMFFQKALGGTAVGIMFGILQISMLLYLDRRVSREENIVQVTSIIGMAYLNFYTADFVWKTSGVISTVVAGLMIKSLGRATINDLKLLEDFLSILEHILNTILFTLGGILWGAAVASGEKMGVFHGIDWAYLFLLYVMLHIIRGVLFASVYPLTSRIGLKSDPREALFQVYGGLRGALGIALAIALDNEASELAGGRFDTEAELHTTQAFVMVGGIAFMTLVFNGITAGPLLRKLGLADSTEARSLIIKTLEVKLRSYAIDDFVRLLSQPRFYHTDFLFVKKHVPSLSTLTRTQFLDAVRKHKKTHGIDYAPPFLKHVLPHLESDPKLSHYMEVEVTDEEILGEFDNYVRASRHQMRRRRHRRHSSNIRAMMGHDALSTRELRLFFVSILRAQYEKQVTRGELENEHFLAIALDQSLDFASHDIHKGRPLQDWKHLVEIHDPMARWEARIEKSKKCFDKSKSGLQSNPDLDVAGDELTIERAMAFMAAHEESRKHFAFEFEDTDSSMNESAKIVIQESMEQYALAQMALKGYDTDVLQRTASYKLCKILLNMKMHHVEKMVHMGALKESEAEHILEKHMEYLKHLSLAYRDDDDDPPAKPKLFEDIPNPLLQANPRLIYRIENLVQDVDAGKGPALAPLQEPMGKEEATVDC
ncbi:unnamed protein product [Cylindrotheca closterium]|uniref:Cation/H+ exchanger transmembrane domain-containing protein n=1 Tax=Cylindrotheca closterium TaxID=2856 RepID=A0AAD2PY14_9STRA|nr:unnamed protein product [Cylindrotheca closterium]